MFVNPQLILEAMTLEVLPAWINHLQTVSATEIPNLDAVKDINSIMTGDSSQIVEALSNSNSLPSHGPGESLLDALSTENNVAEAIDFSNSEYGSSSVVSDSPVEFHLMRDDRLQR